MKKNKIFLSSPHIGKNEIKYINKAFKDNWVAPLGPNIDAFEKLIQKKTGTKYAAALSSGTASIHLSLVLLNINRGDQVICQSNTFSATANPIIYQGAKPIFIDSEEDTWNMCPDLLRKSLQSIKLKKNIPKAIIPVHIYGMPAKMNQISDIANEYNIPVIEDSAESLGSKLNGKKCGGFGHLGILSFNGNKIITTSGGGALVSNDKNMIKKAKFYSTQSRDKAIHYEHSHIGYNYRMSNILAGIGIGQIEVLDKRIKQRRNNFKKYKTFFTKFNKQGFDIKFQEEKQGYYSNRWLTTILLNPQKNNGLSKEIIRNTMEKQNIEVRPLWKPMHNQPFYKNAKSYINGVSDKLFEFGLCLPSGSNTTKEQFDLIFKTFNKIFKKFS